MIHLMEPWGGTVGIGGIVGYNYKGYIANCYNIANITSKHLPSTVGNITGSTANNMVSNCYYLDTLSFYGIGGKDVNGCAEAKSEIDMQSKSFITTLNESNSTIFVHDENNINNGYPILSWQIKQVTNTVQLVNILIQNPPSKVTYIEGEKFDSNGMIVVATYSDGTTKQISTYTSSPQDELTPDDKYISISYTENGITKTVLQEITVNSKNDNSKNNTINNNSNDDNTNKDNTTSDIILPYTGITIVFILLMIGLFIILAIHFYIKILKYKKI